MRKGRQTFIQNSNVNTAAPRYHEVSPSTRKSGSKALKMMHEGGTCRLVHSE